MIVLDSDTLSILQRGSGEEFERLSARVRNAPEWPLYVTIVSFEEQMRGWLAYVARAKTPRDRSWPTRACERSSMISGHSRS
jgi:tRNA(fMet)-specific endonuclease VapC